MGDYATAARLAWAMRSILVEWVRHPDRRRPSRRLRSFEPLTDDAGRGGQDAGREADDWM